MNKAKSFTNLQIADILRNVAAAYKLKSEAGSRFKIIAYERAADAIEHLSSELKDIWDEGKLEEVPSVGTNIAEHIAELFKTGKSRHFEKLMSKLPPSMFELMKVSGIGPKTAYKLATHFRISKKDPLGELEKIAAEGKISTLEGFGEDSQAEILKAIHDYKSAPSKRIILPYAEEVAKDLISYLSVKDNVKRVDTLGSLRRKASTIGDIDISVSSNDSSAVIDYFTSYPKKSRVLEKGDRTASILLPSGVQVDILVSEPDSYGASLQHFTGSKHHNIALRDYGLKHNMSLSEYGIKVKGKLEKFDTEEKFYKKLGMDFIPPELREDAGEIQAALNHKLPHLVEEGDIKGDLQIHSDFDIETSHDVGESSMEEIVKKAHELNYQYIAFTEHNPSKSKHSESQIVDLLKRKKEVIDKLNYSSGKSRVFKVFNSLEIDILPDGKLPVPEKGLDTLDFAIVSIHSSFRLSKEQMTKRILSALSYPKVKIFAHPTARKINEREGIEANWMQIFEFCKRKNIFIEINADPLRLDLPDFLVRDAVGLGVKFSMGTDSHHKDSMNNMKYAVFTARRGWAEKKDIINTLSLKKFEEVIK